MDEIKRLRQDIEGLRVVLEKIYRHARVPALSDEEYEIIRPHISHLDTISEGTKNDR